MAPPFIHRKQDLDITPTVTSEGDSAIDVLPISIKEIKGSIMQCLNNEASRLCQPYAPVRFEPHNHHLYYTSVSE